MKLDTMEELAESVKEEFQCRFDDLDSDTPFWEYSASHVDDNLDMIFDNFDRLSDYLEAEEIDYLMHSVKLPGLVYSQRVSEFMEKKYSEIVEEVQDAADDSIYDSLGNKVSFVSLVSLPHKSEKHLPEFPTSCLSADVRDYIEAVSESLQVPISMVASIVLTIVSLCVQGKFRIQAKEDWIESLNLYSIVVGCPSERKSPTLKEVEAPVFEYIEKENELRKPEIAEYKIKKNILAGRLKSMQESIIKSGDKSKYTTRDVIDCKRELDDLKEEHELQLILDDVTPEALASVMRRNQERIGIISAEGGMFGMMAGRYSNNTNIDIFLKAYSGEYYHSARMSREEVSLKRPYLTIMLAVQPQVITEIMDNRDFRGRGLLARFLYSVPNSKVGSRSYRSKPISEESRERYRKLIFDLLNIPDLTGFAERTITLSQEADQLSEQYNQWIEKRLLNELAEIEDWAGKLHGNTMRIAGILHVIRHRLNSVNVPLEAETMEAAVEIGMYYLAHAKAAFDIMGLSESQDLKDARYIISRLEQANFNVKTNKTYIAKRTLMRLCQRFKTAEEMQGGLDCLEEHGYISVVKESSGKGRPAENIYINPEYYRLKEEK